MDFYATLSRFYDDLFPPNPKQIRFLTQRRPNDGKVLDIGAGTGGYAAALARTGAQVEALEIGSMVSCLTQTAETSGFRSMDMGMERIDELNAEDYGLIYCIGNTMVHLQSIAQVTEFLRSCRRLLRPEGQLILQIVNYDRVYYNNQTELPEITVPQKQLTLIRKYVIDSGSVQFITLLKHLGEEVVSETRLLALKQAELAQCLTDAGFKETQFYGDFDDAPWSLSSPATIAVSRC